MLLLAISTFLDFFYGFWVASTNRKKAIFFLWLSIINNLGILVVFKYYNFFTIQFQQGLAKIGLHTNPLILNVALPIGISFYTFHGMSYVFDIYRKKQKPVKSFVDYAMFVSFFPLLVAGPIERAHHLLPQIQRERKFRYTQAVEGCRLICWGMFKKVVIADSLAGIVDMQFNNYQNYNGISLVVGAIAFSFQIYGDFSGYSDIAIGTAKLFGFELLSNFKFPYFSRDISEFWRRWHISLSSWFRDYLYIPLGGSKGSKLRTVINTFIIFLVSGFWHGASWNFIIWGGIHACGFMPLLLMNRNRKYVSGVVAEKKKLPNLKELLQMTMTFIFVTIAWIFFRAHSFKLAIGYITQIVQSLANHPKQLLSQPSGISAFFYIFPLAIGEWGMRNDERCLNIKTPALLALTIITILYLLASIGKSINFIYFQF